MSLTTGLGGSHVETNRAGLGLARAAVWSGIALIVAMIQGFMTHFIPPPSPALSAKELAHRFIDRRDEIRLMATVDEARGGDRKVWTEVGRCADPNGVLTSFPHRCKSCQQLLTVSVTYSYLESKSNQLIRCQAS